VNHKTDASKADVPSIVPGQEVFSPEQMRLLLGGISRASYFRIRKSGLLQFSRVEKGRQVVHTIDQYRAYIAYLNSKGEVGNRSDCNSEAVQQRPEARRAKVREENEEQRRTAKMERTSRQAVLRCLRSDVALSVDEICEDTNLAKDQVCSALHELVSAGLAEVLDNHRRLPAFRQTYYQLRDQARVTSFHQSGSPDHLL
jgi:hypothetical protein